MERYFILIPIGLTSVGVYLVGARQLGLSWNGLRIAIGRVLECVRVALGFFVANLAASMVVILAGRLLTRGFVSLYYANDVTLLLLSLCQALAFQWWRET